MSDGRSSSSLRSYSSGLGGPFGLLQESINLVHANTRDVPQQVSRTIDQVQAMESLVAEHTGVRLQGLSILDVGAGQRLAHMKYFAARGNEIVGVDRDVIVQGFDPKGYVKMARTNGMRRSIKTLGRKGLRFDARFNVELERQLSVNRRSRRRLTVVQGDATSLAFASESFDFVYSSSVMQYLDDPLSALREIARVVKPGGAAYVDFMPYTGPNGCLDIRMIGRRGGFPYWVHLRPDTAGLVRENAPLNRLPLGTWRSYFEDSMPASVIILEQPDRQELERELIEIRRSGALLEYDVDELVTRSVSVVWHK
jgi:SAM-dependent methyltransferase